MFLRNRDVWWTSSNYYCDCLHKTSLAMHVLPCVTEAGQVKKQTQHNEK